MKVESYLFFDGRCEEAINFYTTALGAKTEMKMLYKQSPEPPMGNIDPNKVMHASLTIGETRVMMSDGHSTGKTEFKGFGLSISTKTTAEAEKFFTALSDGGKVQMPLNKTFFSPAFGMTHDKFGVLWMIMVEQAR